MTLVSVLPGGRMGFGGFGSLGFGRVWVIGWAVGVWGGGRLNGHEKKKWGYIKSWVSK